VRVAIPALFLLLAGWFLFGPAGAQPPIEPPVEIPPGALSLAPVRPAPRGEPVTRIGGVDQRCSDCHALFTDLAPSPPGQILQHEEIPRGHGMNAACLNCHCEEDRNRLVLPGGTEIGFDEVLRLCSGCHGPAYRDWQRGTHGRTSGYWDATRGEPQRLACTECHDPHAPAFEPMAPLPGPRTSRMGDPSHSSEHAAEPALVNPLRAWRTAEKQEPRGDGGEGARGE